MLTSIADHMKACASELSVALPAGWQKVVIYAEFLRETRAHALEGMDVSEYFANGKLVRDFQASMAAHDALRALFLLCEGKGDEWAGVRMEAKSDGTYQSKFFYEGHPLMDGDLEEVRARVDGRL